MQLALMQDTGTSKTIIHVAIGQLEISPFNPRRTRDKDSISKLAERISRNGYEVTRALWVYPEGDKYKIFAGGTRFEAAKLALLETVPVVLHEGFSDDQITRLADEDNENDEYHSTVPIVDKWMDYKRLADMGWKQERIAEAKGVDQAQVNRRLQYADFPKHVLSIFMKNDFLKEGHASEIRKLCNFHNFAPW
jgi:ParB/RepB/Spo0J family partition protein